MEMCSELRPWEDPLYVGDRIAEYRAEPPITYASKVKAPTLLLADVGDWRVTVTR